MSGVNKAIIVGFVGKDPEIRRTQAGAPIASLSVATSESWRDKTTGERTEKTEWHRVVVWGKTAENCAQYLSKGRSCYVEGRLQTRSWDDKESGQKKYRTEILVNELSLLGSKSGGSGGGEYSRSNTASFEQPAPAEDFSQSTQITDDDIPF